MTVTRTDALETEWVVRVTTVHRTVGDGVAQTRQFVSLEGVHERPTS